MPQPIDIDYARAELADVVRKKFRRPAVWFVVVTVVVMGIGGGWVHSLLDGGWWTGESSSGLSAALSDNGWITMFGPERTESLDSNWSVARHFDNDIVGCKIFHLNEVGFPKWQAGIRYRTLFLLAMIPWIITLIRLIRSRVKHADRIDR